MSAAKITMTILSIFIVMPIWYFILYRVLLAINAGELVWFLFWVYVPVGILCKAIAELTGDKK